MDLQEEDQVGHDVVYGNRHDLVVELVLANQIETMAKVIVFYRK